QIPENSCASLVCENGYKIVLLFQKPLIVNQYEKERLVLLDRSPQASTELVPVLVTLRSTSQFWKIGHGRELGIIIRVKQRAVVLVAAGAGALLSLCGASSKCWIDVVGRYPDFLHHIGTGVNRRIRSVGVVIAPVIGNQAVACGIDLADRSPAEILYRRIE